MISSFTHSLIYPLSFFASSSSFFLFAFEPWTWWSHLLLLLPNVIIRSKLIIITKSYVRVCLCVWGQGIKIILMIYPNAQIQQIICLFINMDNVLAIYKNEFDIKHRKQSLTSNSLLFFFCFTNLFLCYVNYFRGRFPVFRDKNSWQQPILNCTRPDHAHPYLMPNDCQSNKSNSKKRKRKINFQKQIYLNRFGIDSDFFLF